KLNSAQLNALKQYAETHTKGETYSWIDSQYTSDEKRKHAKQSVRRWIRQSDPKIRKLIDPKNIQQEGPTGFCELCNNIIHNSELQLAQLSHYDVFHHVCNDCAKDRRDRGEYIIYDYEFKEMTVSAGNPKKESEHGKVNHVGAFTNTLRAYNPEDFPSVAKDPSEFDNYYDGDINNDQ